MSRYACIICFACLIFTPEYLRGCEDDTEVWKTSLETPMGTLRLVLELRKNEKGDYQGNLVSLDQNNAKIPVSAATIKDGILKFECNSVDARFEGKINNETNEATGDYVQLGKTYKQVFKKIDKLVRDEYLHSWHGIMEAGGREFEFELKVFKTAENKEIAKLDSIGEKVFGLPTKYSIDGDTFKFESKVVGATYEGKLNQAKDQVDGQWKQRGGSFDLVLKKKKGSSKTKKRKLNRPQTPKPPYRYDVSEFNFENQADKVSLSGTLTTPKGKGPFACAILISGSGPQDRDETLFEHKPFHVIADHLTKNGFAVLRYDERGVGKSTGEFGSANSADFARDAEAGIEKLKKDKRIDSSAIGIIGHSEGGLIAPMIAARRSDISFIVSLAGPGVSGRQIVYRQNQGVVTAVGSSKEAMEHLKPLLDKIMDAVDQNDDEFEKTAKHAVQEYFKHLPDEIPNREQAIAGLALQMQAFRSPWIKFFIQHDPAADWEKVKCPVLAINGAKDVQVLADENLSAISAAMKKGGNTQLETVKLESINHLFQKCNTGQVAEYEQIEHTMDPSVLEIMTDWLKKHISR